MKITFIFRQCLHDHIINCQSAHIPCPFSDGKFRCPAYILEREIRQVK